MPSNTDLISYDASRSVNLFSPCLLWNLLSIKFLSMPPPMNSIPR